MNCRELFEKYKFIAILRHIPPEHIRRSAKALYDGGIKIFEITFDPSDRKTVEKTQRCISEIYSMLGDEVCVGAGTVLSVEYARAAYEAGARFIVSPCTDANVIAYTKSAGMLSVSGAYTPTEIHTAYKLGADIVKIFPVLPHGEEYLKNVISPLSHIPFIVTGGINPDTVEKFLDTGAVAVAAGASIITKQLAESGQFGIITENARRHIERIK